MEWLNFAEKYIAEAKLAHAGFCPDERAIRIRFIKAASLFITALQIHAEGRDLTDIAGVSSSKFRFDHGSLQTYKASLEPKSPMRPYDGDYSAFCRGAE